MTPELWQKVRTAVDALLPLSGEERQLALEPLRQSAATLAAQVENLLRQQDTPRLADGNGTADLLGREGADGVTLSQTPPPAAEPLTQIGPYTLLEQVGQGGMGVVWRARDHHFRRSLAIKVLAESHKDKSDLKSRFLEEAQLMGQLQHPGIPPVHDLGALPDGRPYFAMKLIRGQTLAALLKERATAEEDHPRLLAIFEQICQTLAYAHAQGVIHRDLKPGNVMVGAFKEVQVMDWGLAKVVGTPEDRTGDVAEPTSTICTVRTETPDSGTEAGQAMGTPAYMSPEQARGEVALLDERCDVFGLGAILCDILTGKPPFASGNNRDNHRQAMKGDLAEAFARLDHSGADAELIDLARRCLANDSKDRPAHAGEVAQAVAAYREMVRERLRQAEVARGKAQVRAEEEHKRLRMERQKRRLTLTLAALLLLVLTAGIVGTTVALVQAWQQTDRAELAEADALAKERLADQRRAEAEQQRTLAVTAMGAEKEAAAKAALADFLRQQATATAAQAREQAELARKVKGMLVAAFRKPNRNAEGDKVTVAEVLKQVELEIGKLDEAILREELLAAVGEAYFNLGMRRAVILWQQVVDLQTQRLGPDHLDTLSSANNLARAYQRAGQLDKALPLFQDTLKKRTLQLGLDHADTLTSMHNLALAYQANGQLQKALVLFEETLRRRIANLGADDLDTLTSINDLALAYEAAGQFSKALPALEKTLEKRLARLTPDHPDTLTSMNDLALAYQSTGQLNKALVLFKETLEKRKAQLGESHPDTLATMHNLAVVYFATGQLQKALPLLEETEKQYRTKWGADHPDTLKSLNSLALVYQAVGQSEKALPLLQRTLKMRQAKLGLDHPSTLQSMNNLGAAYYRTGRFEQAIPLLQETLAIMQAQLGANHPDTLTAMNNLASAYLVAGQLHKALPLFEETLQKRKAVLGASHPHSLATSNNLATAYFKARRYAEAEGLFPKWIESLRPNLPAGIDHLALALNLLGECRVMLEKFAEAEAPLRESLVLYKKIAPEHTLRFDTESLLGAALAGQRRFAAAEAQLVSAAQGFQGIEARLLPADKKLAASALSRVIALYDAWGKKDEAAKWRALHAGEPMPVQVRLRRQPA